MSKNRIVDIALFTAMGIEFGLAVAAFAGGLIPIGFGLLLVLASTLFLTWTVVNNRRLDREQEAEHKAKMAAIQARAWRSLASRRP